MATKTDILHTLADELKKFLGDPSAVGGLAYEIWADEDGDINIAPSSDNITGRLYCVEETVLFAKYHSLNVSTCLFATGAGLRLY